MAEPALCCSCFPDGHQAGRLADSATPPSAFSPRRAHHSNEDHAAGPTACWNHASLTAHGEAPHHRNARPEQAMVGLRDALQPPGGKGASRSFPRLSATGSAPRRGDRERESAHRRPRFPARATLGAPLDDAGGGDAHSPHLGRGEGGGGERGAAGVACAGEECWGGGDDWAGEDAWDAADRSGERAAAEAGLTRSIFLTTCHADNRGATREEGRCGRGVEEKHGVRGVDCETQTRSSVGAFAARAIEGEPRAEEERRGCGVEEEERGRWGGGVEEDSGARGVDCETQTRSSADAFSARGMEDEAREMRGRGVEEEDWERCGRVMEEEEERGARGVDCETHTLGEAPPSLEEEGQAGPVPSDEGRDAWAEAEEERLGFERSERGVRRMVGACFGEWVRYVARAPPASPHPAGFSFVSSSCLHVTMISFVPPPSLDGLIPPRSLAARLCRGVFGSMPPRNPDGFMAPPAGASRLNPD